MRLIVDECSHCNRCMEVCPQKANLSCRHCREPECVKACPKGAFYEAMPGVWGVDRERCDGCGICADACPYKAITISAFARKCDLCAGKMKCIGVCVRGLRLEESAAETAERERILGWRKVPGEYETGIYSPSFQESALMERIMKVFRELAKEGETSLEEAMEGYCEEGKISLSPEQKEELLGLMEWEARGFSVLEPMLEDDGLEEITVNGVGEPIRVYRRGGGWADADVAFLDEKKVVGVINRIARPLGRRITMQKPRINASLPNGSRLHAAIPPIAKSPCLTIRKFTKKPMTPRLLVENRTISSEALSFLWMAMQSDLNIMVAGSTGSGKTTTLNCLGGFMPLRDRIVVVEETPEITLPHEHCVRLTVSEELGLGMNELVNDTLRMRPDRVVVGEVRTADEARALMNTVLAGQGKGSISTFHALNSREAVGRLRNLGISERDLPALDLIVVQKRWDRYDPGKKTGTELRRVMEISEISVDGALPVKIFEYDYQSDSLKRSGEGRIFKRMMESFGLNEAGFALEWARRKAIVENSSEDFGESVREMDEAVFGGA